MHSNGVYLAADYALAVECLPNKEDGAKDLALWGIAAFCELICMHGHYVRVYICQMYAK